MKNKITDKGSFYNAFAFFGCILSKNSGKSNMIKTNRNSLFGKLEKFWEQYSNINLGWSAEAEVGTATNLGGGAATSHQAVCLYFWFH